MSDEVDQYLTASKALLDQLHQFPTIKEVYIKYNTTLASSADSERLFSKGGLVFNTKRHRLHDEEFEKALLLNCNKKNSQWQFVI